MARRSPPASRWGVAPTAKPTSARAARGQIPCSEPLTACPGPQCRHDPRPPPAAGAPWPRFSQRIFHNACPDPGLDNAPRPGRRPPWPGRRQPRPAAARRQEETTGRATAGRRPIPRRPDAAPRTAGSGPRRGPARSGRSLPARERASRALFLWRAPSAAPLGGLGANSSRCPYTEHSTMTRESADQERGDGAPARDSTTGRVATWTETRLRRRSSLRLAAPPT